MVLTGILLSLFLLSSFTTADKIEDDIGLLVENPTMERGDVKVANESQNLLSNNKKPNILLILADDVGTGDVPGYWSNNIASMENLSSLQEKGVTFMDAHSTPLCAPSRYMLLSGNYGQRGKYAPGGWGLYVGQTNLDRQQKSIAHMLKGAGYRTAMYGKYHLGGGVPEGGTYNYDNRLTCCNIDWSKPMVGGPPDLGFDESFYTIGGIQDPPYSFFRDGYLTTDISDVKYWEKGEYDTANNNGKSIINKAGEGDPDWDCTEFNMRIVQEVEDFLEKHDQSNPFFIYAALGEVHVPHSPPNFYLDGTPIAGTHDNKHLDLLYEMDKVIGSLISSVESRGMMENTLVIFASDNGGLNMGYPDRMLRGAKGQIYEGGHRVPFVMRYDGVLPAGERRNNLIGLNDVFATIAEFTGTKVPDRSAQDSISFAQHAISDKNPRSRRKLGTWAFKNGKIKAESLRLGKYKYIKHHSQPKKYELFNIQDDIKEENNLLETDPTNTDYRKLKRQMNIKLRKLGPCPLDKRGSAIFKLENGRKKGNEVTCDWFRAKPNVRCEWQVVGELFCNSICGRHRKYCDYYWNPIPE